MDDVRGEAGRRPFHQWWALAARGACAVLFGILAIIWPLMTLLTLVILFGSFAIVSGVLTLIGALRGEQPREPRMWMVVSGMLGIVAGMIAWIWPGITALALLLLIAAYALVVGVVEIVAAVRRHGTARVHWSHLAAGVLAVVFGVLLFAWPASGALALTWLIGVFAILYGGSLLYLAARSRELEHRGAAGPAAQAV